MKTKQPPKNSAPDAVPKAATTQTVTNGATTTTTTTTTTNGLGGAIGFGNGGGGFPFNQGTWWTEQVSNVNTIFKNLRWYLVSNFRQVLCQVYVEIGLVQTIVDVPVDDALRGGIEIKSKQLDEDQIKEVQISMDREDDLGKVGQAGKWNRLFGGAGLLTMTDQPADEPLDLNSLNEDTPLEFRPVDMWELFYDKQQTEGFDPTDQEHHVEFYNYYGIKVHKSRVMVLKGLEAPSFVRPRLRGWGYSVVEKLVRSLNQYLKATDLNFEVLDEFKLDVYKIKNLTSTLMSPKGEEAIRQRVQMANWQKNYQNAVVMDSEDDFDHKQISFAGLAEAGSGIRMQVASDMRMPLTKIFGTSAAGFNSGEDDIEVYNAMVESEVRSKIKYVILRVIEIKCQQKFGFIPDDIEISFKPLRVLSSEQEENVKNSKFNRLMAAKSASEITTFEFREACNKDSLLSITLDNTSDSLNPEDPDVADLLSGADEVDQTVVDESSGGANDEDTAKVTAAGSGTGKAPIIKTKSAPEAKVQNNVAPFTPLQVLERARAERIKNSAAFDRASYAADGGENWIDPARLKLYEDPKGRVNQDTWDRAKVACQKAFGTFKLSFVLWWYEKQGGKFREQSFETEI